MLLDALLPLRCPACGRLGAAACAGCVREFAPAHAGPTPPGLVALRVPFSYEGPARELIARIKYRGAHAAVGLLADAIAATLDAVEVRGGVVTWAPTTAAHRRARGFDHAARLAGALARRLDLPHRALLARLPGPPQTGRRRGERLTGPRFSALAPAPHRILVVDDVVTTGATMTAAARALGAADGGQPRRGARPVEIIGVAGGRTP